jgi:hypothetical protein
MRGRQRPARWHNGRLNKGKAAWVPSRRTSSNRTAVYVAPGKTPIVIVSEHRNRQADRGDGVACAPGFNRAEVADGALTS